MATIFYEPTSCTCGNKTTYTKASINAACTQALSRAKNRQTLGRDKYPHVYNDYEKFQFSHAQKPYLEFPVLKSGEYKDESPGADRVVIGSISKDFKSAIFCAVLTHDESEEKNGFRICGDDTVNNGGEGSFEGRGEGKEMGEGRELVERIDL